MTDPRIPDRSAVASPPRRDLDYRTVDAAKSPLDAGGQALVYEAAVPDDEPPDRIALKEPADPGTLTGDVVETFLEEARTWELVDRREREKHRWADSEHVVGVIDTGERLPWIAMEYMDGGDLAERLDGTDGLALDEALWVGECVCRGIELAHNYGVVHLDVKPSNVLFRTTPGDAWDVPKIADWGLARSLSERTRTMEGLSVTYAAPEQFEPDEFGDPDMLTDVYQVGALVYALLTGRPPYVGNRMSVMHDVVYGDPPAPPSAHRDDASPALDAVVSTALETSKRDRYDAVQIFRQALRAARTDRALPPIVADRLSADDRSPRVDAAESASTDTGSTDAASSDGDSTDADTGDPDEDLTFRERVEQIRAERSEDDGSPADDDTTNTSVADESEELTFRERVEQIRAERSEDGESPTDDDSGDSAEADESELEDLTFRERVEQIREERSEDGESTSDGSSNDSAETDGDTSGDDAGGSGAARTDGWFDPAAFPEGSERDLAAAIAGIESGTAELSLADAIARCDDRSLAAALAAMDAPDH
ncbi:serine/threonine protein kinase [Halomicrobium mukohataei]|uniref:Serine/threonine protein kinase n=2 Tax=Halomicrobium mukohataei TaxID=57705 RepID=C7P4Z3_HALMD|nr:serine/threonine protein kinase [Halomicrobium mukohataei]ACV49388.1 serine/threonine protein kinase [Halomicrobium mukohataei DSM 12286]QCD67216.1 serine/threonine protein kinase [Halomicrobium mukohataei]